MTSIGTNTYISTNTYIGIDPGKKGAVFVLGSPTRRQYCYSMEPRGSTCCPHGLADWLEAFNQEERPLAIVEHVHAMPKQGVSSSFHFGTSYGIVLGVLATLGIPYTVVRPATWMKRMHAGVSKDIKPKERSRLVLQRRMPQLFKEHKRVSEGVVDAALLALYGKEMNL